jgi:magnesium-protoporphyrin IX monomethyl ester (oxidative) cyclase
MASTSTAGRAALRAGARRAPVSRASAPRAVRAQAAKTEESLGFKTMRKGIKEAAPDTVLTPRFYTTDFDEMEQLFSEKVNPNLRMDELDACLNEFRNDYNQTHFVRNEEFKVNLTSQSLRSDCFPASFVRLHRHCDYGSLLCVKDSPCCLE